MWGNRNTLYCHWKTPIKQHSLLSPINVIKDFMQFPFIYFLNYISLQLLFVYWENREIIHTHTHEQWKFSIKLQLFNNKKLLPFIIFTYLTILYYNISSPSSKLEAYFTIIVMEFFCMKNIFTILVIILVKKLNCYDFSVRISELISYNKSMHYH